MQTRLPARLPAPKLLLLAHVINLEQSGERRSGGWWPEAWSLGVEVLISVLTGFRFTWEPRREREREREREATGSEHGIRESPGLFGHESAAC